MRLGLILTTSFLLMAGVVALVGYLFKGTSDAVQAEVEAVRQNSIAAFMGAAEMAVALQQSQLAAQQIIAARLQGLVEPTHDTGPLPGLEDSIERAEDSLTQFESWVTETRQSVAIAASSSSGASEQAQEDDFPAAVAESLIEIEKQFAVYKTLMDRFTHLAEWHPTEQLSEFFVDQLQPAFEDELAPGLRLFEENSRQVLTAELDRMESAHRRANRRNGIVAVASFMGALILGLVIARSISKPLGALQEGVSRVAKGELATRVEVKTDNEIGVLADAFNKMVTQLEASTVSRTYLDSIIQSVNEMLFVTDADGRIRTVNRAVHEGLGYDLGELIGKTLDDDLIKGSLAGLEVGENEFRDHDGETIPVYCSRSELRSETGEFAGMVLVALDLRRRKETEARLRASIAEKDVLLREIHHRVKNNLQIVSSLLSLQDSSDNQTGETERVLRDSRNRVRSMALIHEQLYKSEDLARIDFRAYVEELVVYLTRSFDLNRRRIEVLRDVDALPLSVDLAIPCGMIINELVANGVEHAYPEGDGVIRVAFHLREGRYSLTVADDGVGVPAEIDPSTAPTLGLRLIWALGKQLGAEVRFDRGQGTVVSVGFAQSHSVPSEVPA